MNNNLQNTPFILKLLMGCFGILLIGDLVSIASGADHLHAFFKIMLMPVLAFCLLAGKKWQQGKQWYFIFAGVLFAWAGDIFLLFASKGAGFFIIGLVSFLITHAFYIRHFRFFNQKWGSRWFKKHPLPLIALIVYGIGLCSLLWPKLGDLKLPVCAYTLILSLMLLQALAMKPVLPPHQFRYFASGAAFFVLSDSLLAIDKFHGSFSMAGVLIMATYGIAQGLIVWGTLKNNAPLLK